MENKQLLAEKKFLLNCGYTMDEVKALTEGFGVTDPPAKNVQPKSNYDTRMAGEINNAQDAMQTAMSLLQLLKSMNATPQAREMVVSLYNFLAQLPGN